MNVQELNDLKEKKKRLQARMEKTERLRVRLILRNTPDGHVIRSLRSSVKRVQTSLTALESQQKSVSLLAQISEKRGLLSQTEMQLFTALQQKRILNNVRALISALESESLRIDQYVVDMEAEAKILAGIDAGRISIAEVLEVFRDKEPLTEAMRTFLDSADAVSENTQEEVAVTEVVESEPINPNAPLFLSTPAVIALRVEGRSYQLPVTKSEAFVLAKLPCSIMHLGNELRATDIAGTYTVEEILQIITNINAKLRRNNVPNEIYNMHGILRFFTFDEIEYAKSARGGYNIRVTEPPAPAPIKPDLHVFKDNRFDTAELDSGLRMSFRRLFDEVATGKTYGTRKKKFTRSELTNVAKEDWQHLLAQKALTLYGQQLSQEVINAVHQFAGEYLREKEIFN